MLIYNRKRSKAKQRKLNPIKKPISRMCPSSNVSDDRGPKWHASPSSESAAQKKNFHPQRRRGLQRSLPGDLEEEYPFVLNISVKYLIMIECTVNCEL